MKIKKQYDIEKKILSCPIQTADLKYLLNKILERTSIF